MKQENHCRGFTLTEILVGLTLLGLILGTLCQIFLSQAEANKRQTRVLRGQQGLRMALEIIARDFKSAGYPFGDHPFLSDLSVWVPDSFVPKAPQAVTPTGVLTVTSGGNQPDLLSLFTVLSSESNPTVLAQATLVGDTLIRLAINGSQTNEQYNLSDMIYIGKPAEPALVKEISGPCLTIDTDPVKPGNQGLKKAYPPGTEVGEISLVSYAVFNDQNDTGGHYHEVGVPVLKRKTNACGFEPLVEDVTDLKVILIKNDLYRLQVSVAKGLPRTGDGSTLTMSTRVMKRN
ncbi:MAG: prepilin-type N-terminal cleavage/methylation domain-containing protein [Deltaproteobacteria bacterium]|nr:prepilin-type N-terminal cleavage/methylation domain-containing protein [Deltaproteobacteria bacterium]